MIRHFSLPRCGTVVVVIIVVVVVGIMIGVLALRHAAAPDASVVPSISSTEPISDPQLGRRIYANCQACHGIDGRGIAGYAPSLIAAPSLAGDAQAAILRVLIGGNRVDGFNAIMPGFSRLTDGEVAAVMSYVRSAWGNTGTPIDVATVTAVRHRIADPRSAP